MSLTGLGGKHHNFKTNHISDLVSFGFISQNLMWKGKLGMQNMYNRTVVEFWACFGCVYKNKIILNLFVKYKNVKKTRQIHKTRWSIYSYGEDISPKQNPTNPKGKRDKKKKKNNENFETSSKIQFAKFQVLQLFSHSLVFSSRWPRPKEEIAVPF